MKQVHITRPMFRYVSKKTKKKERIPIKTTRNKSYRKSITTPIRIRTFKYAKLLNRYEKMILNKERSIDKRQLERTIMGQPSKPVFTEIGEESGPFYKEFAYRDKHNTGVIWFKDMKRKQQTLETLDIAIC